MKLIDADSLYITTIITDDYRGNEILDVVMKEDIDNAPTVEAIPKDEYENRLKADMVAILTEIQLEIEELSTPPAYQDEDYFLNGTNKCSELIQQKIDKYKTESEEYVNFADDLLPIMDEAESEK